MSKADRQRYLRIVAGACFAVAVFVAVLHGGPTARQALVSAGLFFAVVSTL